MSRLYVMKKGHEEIDLTARLPSVTLLEVRSGAPQLNPNYTAITGSDGQRLQSIAFNSSTVTVSLLIKGLNRGDFNLSKSALQRELYARVPLRIRTSDNPGKAMWVVANPTDITPLSQSDDGQVDFTFTVISGTKITPFRSDEIASNQDKLDFGMGIPDLDNLPSYSFSSNSFNIYNPSDLEIDPYIQHHDLIIKIRGNGSSVVVTNQTNGTSFTANTSLSGNDELVMNGITLFKNGQAGQVDTDFSHIVLAKGNNNITVSGLSGANVTFSFPFLYF
ncbi:phage tail domain-containing protein [Convivina praedatoris]|uniref:phage tail domain-containing protein n=1 Tax=Convivina praedatoris TaxID=2880963 RepID=UPI00200E7626|nr:phage tail domain-containing protein [Convivina sp. LMG 32447]CAH1855123.1 hypothetical protein R078138_01064 [Convivina sp. LMG 32447]